MTSPTKAGQLWQLMHSNENFGSSLLLAVSQDDTDGVLNALDLVDLPAEDFNLTDDVIECLVRGVTPSGTLELTTWQGYYVTDPLPNDDKYALLILSSDNTVYWGPEKELIGNFKKYAVSYQVPADGTLQFSTSAGDVKLNFSRTYDIEKGDVGQNSFKGTLGDKIIDGLHTLPPWPTDESLKKTLKQRTHAYSRLFMPGAFDDPSTAWYETPEMSEALVVLGLIGGAAAVVQTFLWFRQLFKNLTRKRVAANLTEVLTESQILALAVASAKVQIPEIDWSSAQDEFTNTVEQKLNEELNKSGIDFGTVDPNSIIDGLRGTAKDSLKAAFEEYALRSIQNAFLKEAYSFSVFPNHLEWAQKLANEHSKDIAAKKLDSLGSDLFNDLCGGVVYEARHVYFHNSYEAASREADAASLEYANAKKLREETEKSIREIDDEIEKDKEGGDDEELLADEKRKEELEKELEERKQEEKEKSEAADKLDQDAKAKNKESEESKRESEERREAWNEGFKL